MANVTIYWKDGTSNSVPDFDLSFWNGQGWSTTKPSTTATKQEVSAIPSWNLSNWTSSGNQWNSQPILTIDGQQFRFNTPQEYIDKMNSAGLTDGQSSLFKQQFQDAQNNWQQQPSTNNNTNDRASSSQINTEYQKYFGRDATPAEISFFSTNPISSLQNELLNTYKSVTGLPSYDGSPIKPGNQKTDNQLKTTTVTPTDNTSANTDATINAAYQKYFGRDATAAEIADKKGVTPAQLDTFLQNEYKNANNGAAYNGSPILPGTNKPTDIPASDIAWVNAAYKKYFDRTATSSELANWAKETPDALSQFLQGEQQKLGYVSKEAGAEKKARYDSAIAKIDASNLPDDIKSMWKTVVGLYPDATDFNTTEIMDTFNKIKTNTIDPYYKELADVAIKDIQTGASQLGESRTAELEKERANAEDAITGAQTGLEASGMTFSGKGVEQLGTGSAYANTNTVGANIVTPFAGIPTEKMQGSVGQSNRLIATSTAAKYKASQQELGRKAEDFLGTAGAAGLGLNYTPAGIDKTASNALAKETKTASTLQSLVDQWRAKQTNALNK